MADFSSTKYDSSFEDWFEQVVTLVEINGYNPRMIDEDFFRFKYEDGKMADDAFYSEYDIED